MRLLPIVVLLLLLGCGPPPDERKPTKPTRQTVLRVATAANVQFAMEDLAAAFQQAHGIQVEATISSSGKLTAQIIEGAPYHLLLSANMKYPKALLADGAAVGKVKIYAEGALVAWTLRPLLLSPEPAYLLSDSIKKIAIANPKNAPYGLQATRYLEHFGLLKEVREKLVYGESVAQTNQYIITQAVSLGITAKSVVHAPDMKAKGHWVELPADSYQPITQGAIITSFGQNNDAESSRLFFDFLSSPAAKRIFQKYGYRVPQEADSGH